VPLEVKKKLRKAVSIADIGQVTQIISKIEKSRSMRDLTLTPVEEENQ
jgi:hypothetical protein